MSQYTERWLDLCLQDINNFFNCLKLYAIKNILSVGSNLPEDVDFKIYC
jgi:hypothetical protein